MEGENILADPSLNCFRASNFERGGFVKPSFVKKINYGITWILFCKYLFI